MTTLPRGRAFSRSDLDAMPADGNRYELVDGALIVTPSPRVPHQGVVGELYLLLRAACPPGLRVYLAPLDIVLGERTILQPDLLVTTVEQTSGQEHQGVPLLAVEVLSPSTRHIDLGLKRSRYEAAGCGSYWVMDPEELRLRAWDLRDGGYVEVADVVGESEARVTSPFPITLSPASLRP